MNENNNEINDSKPTEIKELSDKALELPEKAFKLLDNFINTIENKLKTEITDSIVEKAKVSKKKGKTSEVLTEKDMEIFDSDSIKNQYSEGLIAMFLFINPFLEMRGIDGISDKEIQDLVNSIINLFTGNLKKILKNVETSYSWMKNAKKLIDLGKAFWNIVGKRIKVVRDLLLKSKAKREVKKLEQIKNKNKEEVDLNE